MNLLNTTTTETSVQVAEVGAGMSAGVTVDDLADVREGLAEGLKTAMGGKESVRVNIAAPTQIAVTKSDADGSRHVVTTSTLTLPGGRDDAVTTHAETIYGPDGSISSGALDIDGADGLGGPVLEAIKSSIRQTVEEDTTSAVYRLPLTPGASRTDAGHLAVAIPVPINGLTTNTFTLTSKATTTYIGRRGSSHRFKIDQRMSTDAPFVAEVPGDEAIRTFEVSVPDGQAQSEITMGEDGRILDVTANSSMTLRIVLTFPGDLDGVTATLRFR